MELYNKNDNYELYQGNMLDMLEVISSNSIDSIVTDPPYELNFMNKGWDNIGISYKKQTWEKCYEVLKPGGYLLAFGGSRTFHRIACAIEDAGFEIRDTIMWLYGSGFPKSMNVGLALDKKNGTFEIKEAQDKNKYLQLIEEELKKQGVENIEWK
jgi:site-specific DNA-methyltransferase (adenine-specific)